jgi:hypothetical protein
MKQYKYKEAGRLSRMTACHVGIVAACYNSSKGSNPDIFQESVKEQFQKRGQHKLQKIQKD